MELTVVDTAEDDEALYSDVLQFPCIVIEGIDTISELRFIAGRETKAEDCLPLYASMCGIVKQIGFIDFTLDTFQILHMLNPDYVITLHKGEDAKTVLDLDSEDTYIKLIKIS